MMTEQEQAELVRLRAENLALRCAMDAIRALTGIAPPPPAPIEPLPAPAATPPPAPIESEPAQDRTIRFLADLRTYDLAPRASFMKRDGKWLPPFWMPPAPHIVDQVRYSGFQWTADGYSDVEGARLDRSGAHVASAASVRVAFGQLIEQEEPIRWNGKPGYWRVDYAPWGEDGTPHPLGGAAREAERVGSVWVPHTRVKLLADLAVQGRWPELGPMPAWIAEHEAEMSRWARHVNDWRCTAIDTHGRDSAEYRAVKEGYSMAVSLMIGTRHVGESRKWECDVQRPDWAHAIRDLSACNMWRWCDDLNHVAIDAGYPEYAPFAIQAQDELWVPPAAVELFTTTARRPTTTGGKPRTPLRIDETGKTLGTWKLK